MRTLLISVTATASMGCYAAPPKLECQFDTFFQVLHAVRPEIRSAKVSQTMKIVSGRTDPATLKLDGSIRATNSRRWTPIGIEGMETWESSFVGDFREMLTLKHDLGANKRPLKGMYQASLVTPGVEETHVLTGMCSAS